MSKVRGTSFLGTLQWVRERHGRDGVDRVLARLSPASRQAWGDGDGATLLATGWYETSALSDFSRELDAVFGAGDLKLAREVGREIAFQDVNRFFKWLFRLAGPSLVFGRAAAVWNNYYSEGTYVFEGIDGSRGSIRIDDWHAADEVLCARVEGWVERAVELTIRTRGQARVREVAHLATDPAVSPHRYCKFVAEWDPA
ncbi:MAG: hypothetical protein KJ067_05885 [Vicinamibacteria bacterium]|nr:hypothetical protein [Vicinamibacteria bacterium]